MWWRLLVFIAMALPLAAQAGQVRPAFYDDPPQCIIVLGGPVAAGIVAGERIAEALARQLSGRVGRVIHPLERRRLVRSMAVDLEHPTDARHFAAATRCPALLRWRVLEAGHDNALVWSRKHITLNAALIRARDGAVLWRARSTASRSSGDVPPPHSRAMTTPSLPCWTTWPAACWPVCRICVRRSGFGQQGKCAQDVRDTDRRGRREMFRRQLIQAGQTHEAQGQVHFLGQ